jgi:hypothetical protein
MPLTERAERTESAHSDAATGVTAAAGDARQPQLLDLDKLDQRLMYGQILTLAQTIGTLVALPASAL